MCGLCSQHCPTYALTLSESESPRGRIALINAANLGQFELDQKASEHLKHCIGCRACENFCPSGVRFGEIMDQGLALLEPKTNLHPTAQRLQNMLLSLVSQPRRLAIAGNWLARYQRWGLQRLLRASGLLRLIGLKNAEQLLPSLGHSQKPFRDYSPARGEHRGDVALFTGCISSIVERETLETTQELLNHLGYGVHIPSTQTCCGALHRHSGQPETANALASSNLSAFAALDVTAIVHTASGCTAQLAEYGRHMKGTPRQSDAEVFSHKVKDITTFLVELIARGDWPPQLRLKSLSQSVLVHTPCSLRNVLREEDSQRQLLNNIPDIDLKPLPDNLGCCGAGGGYMLTQPEFSRQLRDKTLAAIDACNTDQRPGIMVTSNVGCALNLAAGLREQGREMEILHPVTLLARQLGLD